MLKTFMENVACTLQSRRLCKSLPRWEHIFLYRQTVQLPPHVEWSGDFNDILMDFKWILTMTLSYLYLTFFKPLGLCLLFS